MLSHANKVKTNPWENQGNLKGREKIKLSG